MSSVMESQDYRRWWAEQQPDIPYGYCWCGCGEPTRVSPKTERRFGHVKGEPVRYIAGHAGRNRGPVYDAQSKKLCRGCGDFKDAWEFSRAANTKDGLRTRCKSCMGAYQADWYARNRDQQAEYHRHRREERGKRGALWPEAKKCSTCKEVKSAAAFWRDRGSHDGLAGHCKVCQYEYRLAWLRDNPEKVREYGRKNYERNGASHRGRQRRRYATDPEYRERVAAGVKRWQKRNAAKLKARGARRRSRLKGARGLYTAEQWAALVEFYGACLRCGAEGPLTPDHVIPLAKGGANHIGNIQPLCGSCNSSKGVKDTDYRDRHLHSEFMAALEELYSS